MATTDIGCANADDAKALARLIGHTRSWLASRDALVTARLDALHRAGHGLDSHDTNRTEQRGSGAETRRNKKRADLIGRTPAFGDALAQGDITEHADVVANALGELDPDAQNRLLGDPDSLLAKARRQSVEGFRKTIKRDVDAIRDDEGLERLERQRRATTLSKWFNADGMLVLNGQFDPETGAIIDTAIDNELKRHWKTHPADPEGRNIGYDTAHALARLLTGSKPGSAPIADITFLQDIGTATSGVHPGTVSETGTGTYMPPDVIRRHACDAFVTIVERDGAGQVLNVGRTRRTATGTQRRALRSMYTPCAFPRCATSFDWCHMHHIDFWTPTGPTDLDNLTPLCAKHHHWVHEGKWTLKLLPDRTLKVYTPDGTHHATQPPPTLATTRHDSDPDPPEHHRQPQPT